MLNYNRVGKKGTKVSKTSAQVKKERWTPKTTPKPRSFLQQLHCKVQWAINFSLQPFSLGQGLGNDLHISAQTTRLMIAHRDVTTKLKQSLQADYTRQRDDILDKREAAKATPKLEKKTS